MQEFDYVRVYDVHKAAAILSREDNGARVLSGGTDLLVQLRERQQSAKLLVDIKYIPEVNQLTYDPTAGLTIGSAVTCLQISTDPSVSKIYPGLVDAVSLIGGVQIQGRASVGGNLCNASPAADSIPALIVHSAVCLIADTDGYREVPVEQFCTAPGKTVLTHGELLVSLRIPPPPPRFGAHYLRFTPRNEMDIAVVGAGASIVLDEGMKTIQSARLALAAVAPKPLLVETVGDYLTGRDISPETIQMAAQFAREAAQPIRDMRGTVDQRGHLAGVLSTRALEKAIERAKTQGQSSPGRRPAGDRSER
jgi:carbon-monoxide dehydrogenase medium subunit